MEEIVNQLLVVAEGLALLGTTWFIWFISGVANNLFSPKKWSWKRTAEDLLKTFLMIVATLGWVVVISLLEYYTSSLGFDISKLLDGASVVGLIGIIVGGASVYAYKGYRNIIKFFIKDHTVLEQIEKDLGVPESISVEKYAEVAEPVKQVIGGIFQYFTQPKESVDAHKEWEEKSGGKGQAYNVRIDSYDNFRADVYGKGFNIDGAYGAQCWDGTCLLWQQLGMWLQTGNGCAYGSWMLKKDVNIGSKFELVTDKTKIKRGDVLVFQAGEYGHIGFADEDYNGNSYIRLLGQNQGGIAYAGGGSCFNVINMSLVSFLGAFRYKGWIISDANRTISGQQPDKTTSVTSTVSGHNLYINKGDRVIVVNRVDVHGIQLLDLQKDYLVYQVRKSDRTAVLKTDDGDVYARISFDNLKRAV